jgi:sigma-B regulation protein RsbU (phosphoserine phosphatase)
VFNYTDGLVESPNEEVYISDQELVSHLLESCLLEVDNLNETILKNIQTHKNAKMDSDDITLLTIRVL